jgi:hypothetical protein
MVNQYPHFLFIVNKFDSVQDSEGNFTNDGYCVKMHAVCREETNGKGATVNGTDGRAMVYAAKIFMPPTTPRITEGTEIFISQTNDKNGIVRIKGQVLKFDVGQLHCRIWV